LAPASQAAMLRVLKVTESTRVGVDSSVPEQLVRYIRVYASLSRFKLSLNTLMPSRHAALACAPCVPVSPLNKGLWLAPCLSTKACPTPVHPGLPHACPPLARKSTREKTTSLPFTAPFELLRRHAAPCFELALGMKSVAPKPANNEGRVDLNSRGVYSVARHPRRPHRSNASRPSPGAP
jgi:hypothetical protein